MVAPKPSKGNILIILSNSLAHADEVAIKLNDIMESMVLVPRLTTNELTEETPIIQKIDTEIYLDNIRSNKVISDGTNQAISKAYIDDLLIQGCSIIISPSMELFPYLRDYYKERTITVYLDSNESCKVKFTPFLEDNIDYTMKTDSPKTSAKTLQYLLVSKGEKVKIKTMNGFKPFV